jgi:hypothetical protein
MQRHCHSRSSRLALAGAQNHLIVELMSEPALLGVVLIGAGLVIYSLWRS